MFGTIRRTAVAARLLALAAALLTLTAGALAAEPPQETRITLLHDTHLHGDFGDEALNLAHYAALVNRIRSSRPNTLFLGSGDDLATSLYSALFHGEHMVRALNAAGLDYDTYGNHDFDYGPENVATQVAQSEFTWVSANVIDRRTGDVFAREEGARRFVLREVGGVTVGVTGIAPRDTASLTSVGPHVEVLDPQEALERVVPAMREAGAEIVVVLSHEAWPETERIAAAVPGVDVYVGDHAAEVLAQPHRIGGALVSRVGAELDYLGELTLIVRDGKVSGWEFLLHDVRAQVEAGSLYPDVRVERVIDDYARRLEASLDDEVGRTLTPLDAHALAVRSGESPLGNFVADALRSWAGADAAIQNGGGLRGERVFGPGPLTRADILSILPFTNYAVKLRLSGAELLAALEHGVAAYESGHGRFPQVSGIAFAFDPEAPPGERVFDVTVGGRPLDPDGSYTVATNDFLASGGDGYAMLAEAERIIPPEAGELLSTLVIRAVQEAGAISPKQEGRIRIQAKP